MQDTNQNYIDLKPYFKILFKRIKLIAIFTCLVTIISIIYASSLKPTYEVFFKFKPPIRTAFLNIDSNIDEQQLRLEREETAFVHFVNLLSSPNFQKNIYLDKTLQMDNTNDEFLNKFINSIRIDNPGVNKSAYIPPYKISLRGDNPDLLSKYLNILINSANKDSTNYVNNIQIEGYLLKLETLLSEREIFLDSAKNIRLNEIAQITESDSQRIREINSQIAAARFEAKQKRLNMIEILSDAALVAKSLGIKTSNFRLLNSNESVPNVTINMENNALLPKWYLYGEEALRKEIEILRNRSDDDPFIPELVSLKNQLKMLQNNNLLITLRERKDDSPFIPEIIDLDIEISHTKNKVKLYKPIESSAQFDQEITQQTIYPKRRLLVIISFFSSLFLSILLALFIDLKKYL